MKNTEATKPLFGTPEENEGLQNAINELVLAAAKCGYTVSINLKNIRL
jgi:hypothetical protein